MKDAVKNKVAEWLGKEGYPLEMTVASAFQNKKFEVFQSIFLDDIEENKPREIDVVATKYDKYCAAFLHVAHIIECKKTDKPIIIFTHDNYPSGWNILFLTALMNSHVRESFVEKDKKFIEIHKKYSSKYCGYSITQAFTNKHDMAYSAAMKVIKSAHAHMIEDDRRNSYKHFYIAYPIIIFDADIFVCSLDKQNNIELQETEIVDLFMPITINNLLSPIVKIVSASYIEKFTSLCEENFQEINKLLHADIETLWSDLVTKKI